jgi:hypothetical protein
MQGLEVWNHEVMIRVACNGQLAFRLMPEGEWQSELELQRGRAQVSGAAPVDGLLHYAMSCVFESLVVRVEGTPTPVLDRAVGQWPEAIDDDELDTYPYLHFLEERKTGTPWRLERWYTVAGPCLVFDSEQYFERPRPVDRGKSWERLIIRLRQVVNLAAWVPGGSTDLSNLASVG